MGSRCMQIVLFLCITSYAYSKKPLLSVDSTYYKGLDAYKAERWSECVVQFEDSIHLYKLYKNIRTNCKHKCKSKEYDCEIIENIEELRTYEKIFNLKNCVTKCEGDEFRKISLNPDVQEYVQDNMESKTPYAYLQMCYYQRVDLPKAASATYTYLLANPDSEDMRTNLEFYMKQPEVNRNEVEDLESTIYAKHFKLGFKAYEQKRWDDVIVNMEKVIQDYLLWENDCRVECEYQPDQQFSPEFITTLSNHIASLLHCQQNCQKKLKQLNHNDALDFLADVLNYLQISYHKVDRNDEAVKALTSYLTILPNDPDMLTNKKFYSSKVSLDAFTERQDISYYVKRDLYEKKLLNIFNNENVNEASK